MKQKLKLAKHTQEDIFPHANTVVCMEENKLLKRFQYEILYAADGLEGTLKELNDINYFSSYDDADVYNYTTLMGGITKETMLLLKSIAPNPDIWRAFVLEYDIHNMKLVAKERLLNKKLDNLAFNFGSYSLSSIRSATVRANDNILENDFLTEGFFSALESKDMYSIDFILDRTYLKVLKDFAIKLGNEAITNFVIEKIDLYNISAFLQMMAVDAGTDYFFKAFSDQGNFSTDEWQKFFDEFFTADYADNSRRKALSDFPALMRYGGIQKEMINPQQIFNEFDVLMDNYLIKKTTGAKLMSFGIEPICAYFYNKLMEIKNIRILLTGKKNDYPISEIRRRERMLYEL